MYSTEEIFNNIANSENLPKKFYKVHNATFEERVKEIKNLHRSDHINAEELINVEKLINNHADRFYIPGERLSATNVLQHKIPTTNDQPVFAR